MDVKISRKRTRTKLKGIEHCGVDDKKRLGKFLALVPEEWIKAIPFLVRGHATTKKNAQRT